MISTLVKSKCYVLGETGVKTEKEHSYQIPSSCFPVTKMKKRSENKVTDDPLYKKLRGAITNKIGMT